MTVLNRVLNATVQRTADHAAPEITLDPLEIVGGRYFRGSPPFFSVPPEPGGIIRTSCFQPAFSFRSSPTGEIRSSENSYFCQAARQLACVPSSQLCVKLASGGDPTYAFNIRFTGEEVHGTSKPPAGRWLLAQNAGRNCLNVSAGMRVPLGLSE